MHVDLGRRLFVALGIDDATNEEASEAGAILEAALRTRSSPALRAKWPEHVAQCVDDDAKAHGVTSVLEAISRLALEDLALALAGSCGEAEAIADLERLVIEPLPRVLARLRPTPELVDELRQELRTKLLVGGDAREPKLLAYRGRGPLGAWVRVMALRSAYDRARTTTAEAMAEDADANLAELVDPKDAPELAEIRAQYSTELRAAFAEAVRRLDAEERAVLRSHVVDGLTIDQIGALYQIHRATAARWVQQAKGSLLKALRDELGRRLGRHPSACDSVVALVESRIDLSLERVFEP